MKNPFQLLKKLLFWIFRINQTKKLEVPEPAEKQQSVTNETVRFKDSYPQKTTNTSERTFRGKLSGFKSRTERNFHKKALRAYLKGKERFTFQGSYYRV